MSDGRALKTLGLRRRRGPGPASRTQAPDRSQPLPELDVNKTANSSPAESPPPSEAGTSSGRSTRSGSRGGTRSGSRGGTRSGSRGGTAAPRLTLAQVTRLEESFQSNRNHTRAERKTLAASLKIGETQVQRWFQWKRSRDKNSDKVHTKEITKEIKANLNPPNTTAPLKKPGGAGSLKAPTKEVEVVDILDDSMDEPSWRLVKKEKHQCPKRIELVEDLMAQIDTLETELRAKSGALYKTQKDLDVKTDVEKSLLMKEQALQAIETSMSRMVEEHRKLLVQKDQDIAVLKAAWDGLQKDKFKLEKDLEISKRNQNSIQMVEFMKAKEELTQQVAKLESNIQEVEVTKDEAVKIAKEEIKNLTTLKENDITRLEAKMKLSDAGRWDLEAKQAAAESLVELGRRETLDLKSYQRKLEGRVGELEEEVFMMKAELETQGRIRAGLVAKMQDREQQIKVKEEQIAVIDKENKESVAQSEILQAQKQFVLEEAESVKNNLEQKCKAFEKDVILVRAELRNQDRVGAELGAKITDRENQLREKEEQIAVLETDNKKGIAKFKKLQDQNDNVVKENESLKKELKQTCQYFDEEVFLVRAELQNQGSVRTELEAKIQDKENQLREKEEQLAVLEKENKKGIAQIKNLQTQNKDVTEVAETLKKELDQSCQAFKEDVFLLRTDLQNQGSVRNELGAEIRESKNKLREKEEQLTVLEIEHKTVVEQVKTLWTQNRNVVEEADSMKYELDQKRKAFKEEVFLLRDEMQNQDGLMAELGEKVQDKEIQLREKEEQLGVLEKDKKEIVSKVLILRAEKLNIFEEAKGIQKDLGEKYQALEEEMCIVRAGLKTQTKVRDHMGAKIQDKKNQLKEREKQLTVLEKDIEENVEGVNILLKELQENFQALGNVQLESSLVKEEDRSSNCSEKQVGRDINHGEREVRSYTNNEEMAGKDRTPGEEGEGRSSITSRKMQAGKESIPLECESHTGSVKRPLPFPAGGKDTKRPRLCQGDMGKQEAAKLLFNNKGEDIATMAEECISELLNDGEEKDIETLTEFRQDLEEVVLYILEYVLDKVMEEEITKKKDQVKQNQKEAVLNILECVLDEVFMKKEATTKVGEFKEGQKEVVPSLLGDVMGQVILDTELAKKRRELNKDHMNSVLYIIEEVLDKVMEKEMARSVQEEEAAVFQVILEMLQK